MRGAARGSVEAMRRRPREAGWHCQAAAVKPAAPLAWPVPMSTFAQPIGCGVAEVLQVMQGPAYKIVSSKIDSVIPRAAWWLAWRVTPSWTKGAADG